MSTSDRELLELAAKAAGVSWDVSRDSVSGWLLATTVERFDDYGERYFVEDKIWWPLKDDGDALRLAVKLRLEIYFFDGFGEVVAEHNTGSYEPGREQYAEDMNAATRLAIVRAAAEIGRSME